MHLRSKWLDFNLVTDQIHRGVVPLSPVYSIVVPEVQIYQSCLSATRAILHMLFGRTRAGRNPVASVLAPTGELANQVEIGRKGVP
ncbi:hypothetical protein Ancab_002164 [Ancistrocladus abbreviatus]